MLPDKSHEEWWVDVGRRGAALEAGRRVYAERVRELRAGIGKYAERVKELEAENELLRAALDGVELNSARRLPGGAD